MLFLFYFLWVAPNLVLAGVLWCFKRLQLRRSYPLFFAYLIYQLLEFTLLLGMNFLPWFTSSQYRWVYVAGRGVTGLLKFAIVYEVSEHLVLERSALSSILKRMLRWSAAILLMAGAAGSALLFESNLDRVANVFSGLNLLSNVVLTGLVLFLFAFRRVFQIEWRGVSAGIALGFGIFTSLELAIAALQVESRVADLCRMAAFLICTLVWLGYLLRRPTIVARTESSVRKSDLDLWNQELGRMVRR
jgi:hypothetical protein